MGSGRWGSEPDKVPQLLDVNRRLHETTGFGVEGVPALIPPSRFYELLSQGKFPLATFLRRREHIDYIEEPDLFHEVFGHCPLLTNQSYANFVKPVSVKQRSGSARAISWHLFRIFWFTVEFGLINTPRRPPLLRRRHRLIAKRGERSDATERPANSGPST